MNGRPAVFIHGNGIHRTGTQAGTKGIRNGVIGAGRRTAPAFFALIRIDVSALARNGNGTKGAGIAAGTAGNAFIIVNFSLAVIANGNSAHTAGTHTGTMDFDNSAIGAYLLAATALNTFIAIDKGAVLHQTNCFLGAIVHALVGNAVTANIGNVISVDGALVAGGGQHINNGQVLALGLKQGFFGGLDNVFLALLAQCHINTIFQNGTLFIYAAAITRCIIAHLLQNIINMVDEHIVPGITGQML